MFNMAQASDQEILDFVKNNKFDVVDMDDPNWITDIVKEIEILKKNKNKIIPPKAQE